MKQKAILSTLIKNSLYPEAMSDFLPHADFKWENPDDFDSLSIMNISDVSEKGYIFDVDLQYPPHLHDRDNAYPLAPEHMVVEKEKLSPYNGPAFADSTKKLIPNLNDKSNYIVHYRNLKYYIQRGLRLVKIHKVMSFKQSPWMRPYIELCAEKRKTASTNFQKDFWKLMMNAVFGKSMENVRNRVRVELVFGYQESIDTDWQKYL